MQQIDLFSEIYPTFKFDKNKKIKIFESFAGVGMQCLGMKKFGIDYESVGISEIDKNAIISYSHIHCDQDENFVYPSDEEMYEELKQKNIPFDSNKGEFQGSKLKGEKLRRFYKAQKISKNFGDISLIHGNDLPQDIDLFTYSFPCTDLSKSGKQKGLENTRSGLVYEVLRILNEMSHTNTQPKVLIMENVVDLVENKFIKSFNEIQLELESLGYTNYTQILNSKDYGIPQVRKRVFMVSILGDYAYYFPKKIPLKTYLSDLLQDESEVDGKYYLSKNMIEKISTKRKNELLINECTKKGYSIASEGDGVYINRPHQKRGVVQKGMIQTIKTGQDIGVVVKGFIPYSEYGKMHQSNTIYGTEGLSPTLTNGMYKAPFKFLIQNTLTIRKLTPKECWRLMGINDIFFEKIKKIISATQLYKQAGNGIVVDVIGSIIKQLV